MLGINPKEEKDLVCGASLCSTTKTARRKSSPRSGGIAPAFAGNQTEEAGFGWDARLRRASEAGTSYKMRARLAHLLAITALAAPVMVLGQTDEIQVYDANIAEPGIFNVMTHFNFTPVGRKPPRTFPARSLPTIRSKTTVEWAYGVTPWFEQGLCTSRSRLLIQRTTAVPLTASRSESCSCGPTPTTNKFFYGVNFEFSVNHHFWESRTITSEIRPIVGLHLKPWDIIFNPIVDTNYTWRCPEPAIQSLYASGLPTLTADGPSLPKSMTASAHSTISFPSVSNSTRSGQS